MKFKLIILCLILISLVFCHKEPEVKINDITKVEKYAIRISEGKKIYKSPSLRSKVLYDFDKDLPQVIYLIEEVIVDTEKKDDPLIYYKLKYKDIEGYSNTGATECPSLEYCEKYKQSYHDYSKFEESQTADYFDPTKEGTDDKYGNHIQFHKDKLYYRPPQPGGAKQAIAIPLSFKDIKMVGEDKYEFNAKNYYLLLEIYRNKNGLDYYLKIHKYKGNKFLEEHLNGLEYKKRIREEIKEDL